jgi:hypothetical protein
MVVIGAVYGSNSIPVCVAALENMMMDCANLLGKPKILIVQACQGQTQQDGKCALVRISYPTPNKSV